MSDEEKKVAPEQSVKRVRGRGAGSGWRRDEIFETIEQKGEHEDDPGRSIEGRNPIRQRHRRTAVRKSRSPE